MFRVEAKRKALRALGRLNRERKGRMRAPPPSSYV
jgi:hypothetical protein